MVQRYPTQNSQCARKDSIINCDKTWCRVKTFGRYRKRYIWCLVNRGAKIVIYCYEKDGVRSREALNKIIGESRSRHSRPTVTTYTSISTTAWKALATCTALHMPEPNSTMPRQAAETPMHGPFSTSLPNSTADKTLTSERIFHPTKPQKQGGRPKAWKS